MLRNLKKSAPPTQERSDAELLRDFLRTTSPDDLLPLYTRHAELIYALALRYLGTPARAEDAGMEIWAVLLDKLPKHSITNFRSWLQTTVRNHCLMQLRREKRDPLHQRATGFVQSDDLVHLSTADAEESPDLRDLHHCLKKLKEEQRRCIHRFYLQEGESYQTIAAALNLSVGRVRSHLQNGRRNLKICLESRADQSE